MDEGAEVDVVDEEPEGAVVKTLQSIQRTTPDIPHQDMRIYPHLACVNAIGNLESQVSRAWSHTHVSGKISFSQDLRIEDLTSSIRNTTRT